MSKPIEFVHVDGEAMLAEAVAALEQELGTPLYPADERRIMLAHLMRPIIQTTVLVNDLANQNLLSEARGEVLDRIGERSGTVRLPATPARVILRFTLSAQRGVPTVVPAGTRATPDSRIYFATTEALSIPAGALTGEVAAESVLSAADDGEAHNGFMPGRVSALVDPIPFVSGVANVDVSVGGRAKESDDAYRVRIGLAPTRYSSAGTFGAYEYFARGAHVDVVDAKAVNDGPGRSLISIIAPDGHEDPQSVVDTVYAAVNDKEVRSGTDFLTVSQAEVVLYTVSVHYWVAPQYAAETIMAVEGADGALQRYIRWQDYTIGRDINPDKLRSLLFEAGVIRATITAPGHTAVSTRQRAKLQSNMVVTREVISDEA